MKIKNPFSSLTRFELILWCVSLAVVTGAFLLSPDKDALTLATSLIGVTALIFVAKGMVLGQVLTLAFAVAYGAVSFFFTYYGEMFTYLLLSTPAAAAYLPMIFCFLMFLINDGSRALIDPTRPPLGFLRSFKRANISAGEGKILR